MGGDIVANSAPSGTSDFNTKMIEEFREGLHGGQKRHSPGDRERIHEPVQAGTRR